MLFIREVVPFSKRVSNYFIEDKGRVGGKMHFSTEALHSIKYDSVIVFTWSVSFESSVAIMYAIALKRSKEF